MWCVSIRAYTQMRLNVCVKRRRITRRRRGDERLPVRTDRWRWCRGRGAVQRGSGWSVLDCRRRPVSSSSCAVCCASSCHLFRPSRPRVLFRFTECEYLFPRYCSYYQYCYCYRGPDELAHVATIVYSDACRSDRMISRKHVRRRISCISDGSPNEFFGTFLNFRIHFLSIILDTYLYTIHIIKLYLFFICEVIFARLGDTY